MPRRRAGERQGPGQALWSPKTMTMSRAELDARHLERIRRLIGFAYERSPLHRRLYDQAGLKPFDVRSWEDFYRKVPFTDKSHYVAEQERQGRAGQALGEEALTAYFHTTGTTGTFLNEYFSELDIIRMGAIYGYAWWDCGVRPSDSIFICHNFGFWLGLWHMYWAARFFGLTVYSSGGMTTDERIDAILAHRPTMVAGTPTYLMRIARRAAERGIDLSESSVRYLTAGGEPGLNIPVTRRALERAWGAVGIDAYGMSEVGIAHMECGAHAGGVHVMEDAFHAYAADLESGEPVEDGQVGENVVTSYTHLAQPFIKYRSHDLVRRFSSHDHGCGWSFAFLEGSVLGRTDFMIVLRGVNVYPTAVENLIGEVPGLTHEHELHITRRNSSDHLLVRVECEGDLPAGQRAELGERLALLYRRRLGVSIDTEILPPGTIERRELKARRVFDHRPPEERPQIALDHREAGR